MKKVLLGIILGVFVCVGLAGADDAGLVASKEGGKYHLATCKIVKSIKAENKVTFKTPEEAIKAGYSACKVCNPPEKSVVEAALVASKDSDKYHKLDCRLAKNIKDANKVSFATKDDAEKAGYKPCAICFPPDKNK